MYESLNNLAVLLFGKLAGNVAQCGRYGLAILAARVEMTPDSPGRSAVILQGQHHLPMIDVYRSDRFRLISCWNQTTRSRLMSYWARLNAARSRRLW